MTLVNPAGIGEVVGIQTSQKLCLVAKVSIASKERDTGLVPGRGHDGVFAFRTIDGKEIQRLVVGIVQTYGYDDMSHAEITPAAERLLQPELLQLHLATLLGLLFPFAAFLVFLLVGDTCATMLELNLSTERPAFAEVVAQIDDSMWNVEAPVRRVVLMLLRLTVAAHVVAKIVTRETDFSIAADAQSVASDVVHHAVGSIALSHSGHTHEYGYESEYKSFHNKLCG